MAFHLTKWYGDCVTAAGECRIGYWAELEWRGLHVRYAAVLEGGAGTRTTVRAGQGPRREGAGYRWVEPALEVDWRWEAAAPGYRVEWMEGVAWECVMPAARAEAGVEGDGYLERLEMTIEPWRLPIERLRWGHYAGGGDSLVWVDWAGPVCRRLVLRRGAPVEAAEIGDGRVRLASGEELVCDEGKTLRAGPLGRNVLAAVPALKRLAPLRLLRVEEQKRLSRAAVRRAGEAVSEGWAVHEVVRWPA